MPKGMVRSKRVEGVFLTGLRGAWVRLGHGDGAVAPIKVSWRCCGGLLGCGGFARRAAWCGCGGGRGGGFRRRGGGVRGGGGGCGGGGEGARTRGVCVEQRTLPVGGRWGWGLVRRGVR